MFNKFFLGYNVSDNEYKDYINAHCDEKIKLDRVSLKLNEIIANNPAFNFRFKDQKKYTQQQVRGRLFQLFSVHDTTFSKSVEAIASTTLLILIYFRAFFVQCGRGPSRYRQESHKSKGFW